MQQYGILSEAKLTDVIDADVLFEQAKSSLPSGVTTAMELTTYNLRHLAGAGCFQSWIERPNDLQTILDFRESVKQMENMDFEADIQRVSESLNKGRLLFKEVLDSVTSLVLEIKKVTPKKEKAPTPAVAKAATAAPAAAQDLKRKLSSTIDPFGVNWIAAGHGRILSFVGRGSYQLADGKRHLVPTIGKGLFVEDDKIAEGLATFQKLYPAVAVKRRGYCECPADPAHGTQVLDPVFNIAVPFEMRMTGDFGQLMQTQWGGYNDGYVGHFGKELMGTINYVANGKADILMVSGDMVQELVRSCYGKMTDLNCLLDAIQASLKCTQEEAKDLADSDFIVYSGSLVNGSPGSLSRIGSITTLFAQSALA